MQTLQFSAGSEAESGLHVICFCGSDTSDLSCVPGGVLGSNGLSLVGLLSLTDNVTGYWSQVLSHSCEGSIS